MTDPISLGSKPTQPRWVRLAKAVRGSQPFNFVATTSLRAAMRVLGRDSESVVMHLHPVGVVRCRLPNGRTLRLRTRADDFVSNQIYWRGWRGHEPETVPVLWHLARSARTTLDVGAHVGVMALLAAHANPTGRVFAFEPFRPVYQRLEVNRDLNGLSNLECVHAAAGEVNGTLDFYHLDFGDALIPTSSLNREFMEGCRNCFGLPESGLRHTPVPVVTLDAFGESRGLRDVDLVKIDTESTEPSVLRGMVGILARDRPNLIIEVLPHSESLPEIESILTPLGYRHRRLTPLSDHDKGTHVTLGKATGRVDGFDNYLFSTDDPDLIVSRAHEDVAGS